MEVGKMGFFINRDNSSNNDENNPMKGVETPTLPTQERRDESDTISSNREKEK